MNSEFNTPAIVLRQLTWRCNEFARLTRDTTMAIMRHLLKNT